MKFVIVEWQELSKGYISEMSVEPETSVIDPRLLTNRDRWGRIKWTGCGHKEPTRGWDLHSGRVLETHSKFRIKLSYHELYFIEFYQFYAFRYEGEGGGSTMCNPSWREGARGPTIYDRE